VRTRRTGSTIRRAGEAEDTRGAEAVLARIRAFAVPFSALQIATFYGTYPPTSARLAWSAPALLAVGAVAVGLGLRRARTPAAVRRLSLAGLLVDCAAVVLLVVAHTFDPNTAIWALLYLVPLEGALLFGLRGAMWTWAGLAAAYALREVYGALVFDIPFLVVSISFRMGLGLMIAYAFGVTARRLSVERQRLARLSARLADREADLEVTLVALREARSAQVEFIAVTSHELRTPLTAVRGFARTLLARWDEMPDHGRQASVQAIDVQAERLGGMVEDLLTVSAMHAGPVAVHLGVQPLEEALRRAVADSGVEGAVRCPSGLQVVADPARLRQILGNLLSNARKYGAPPVEVDAERLDGVARIRVRDHGAGVPADFQARMWEEFTQASVGPTRTAQGPGLGLAIVRYLARAQGGSVGYRDHPDGGAEFTVELPAAGAEDDGAPEAAQAAVSRASGAGPRG
jgi:signal transduction histidine kinase